MASGFLLGKTGGSGGVMYRAVVIGADGDGLSGMASKSSLSPTGVAAAVWGFEWER
jgi:hypothetical protein